MKIKITHTHSVKGFKAIILFCFLGLISTLSFSQNPNSNPNAQKWQLSGNSTDTNKFVGTTNNVDLIFKRNNTEGFRLRQDTSASFMGDLVLNKFKIPPAPPKERFLKIDNLGKITSLDKSGLLKSIYTLGTTCISTGVNVGIPIWNATSAPTYGILFTGIDCPARVGIGTDNPLATLDVRGGGYFASVVGINNVPSTQNQLTINSSSGRFVGLQLINNHPNGFPFTKYGIKNIVNNANTIAYSVTNQTTNEDVFRVMGDGQVWATEINVDLAIDFPDYVFKSDYELMPLTELENYIKKNHHLPNIPTAEEIKGSGLGLCDMQVKQLEKIEEIILYLFELKKELDAVKKENTTLKVLINQK